MTNTRLIDVRTISENGPTISFTATPAECRQIAERFEIPCVHSLTVQGSFAWEDMITFTGKMKVAADRICGVTLKPFLEKAEHDLDLIFTEKPDELPDDLMADIFPIKKGKIDLVETFSELVGLNLNPFPKSVSDYMDYRDPADIGTENPFAVLKKLKKEDTDD